MHTCDNIYLSGSSSIYDLKQDLLSLTKEKYSTMLTVMKKIKELKFESKQLENTGPNSMEKQGIYTTYNYCWAVSKICATIIVIHIIYHNYDRHTAHKYQQQFCVCKPMH